MKKCQDVNLTKADALCMRVSTDSAIDTESSVSCSLFSFQLIICDNDSVIKILAHRPDGQWF